MKDYDPQLHDIEAGRGIDGARCYECQRHTYGYYVMRNRVSSVMEAAACVDCAARAGWPLERETDVRQRDFVGAGR